jgi:hypothetical protein
VRAEGPVYRLRSPHVLWSAIDHQDEQLMEEENAEPKKSLEPNYRAYGGFTPEYCSPLDRTLTRS